MTSKNVKLRRAAFQGSLLFLAAAGCVRCRATTLDVLTPQVHSIADASAGGASTGIGGSGPECADGIATDQSCSFSSQCCSGLCSLDYNAQVTCRPTPGCLGVGRPCSIASQCCSLACEAIDGGAGKCVESAVCAVIGGNCSVSSDCCSNLCDAGTCVDPGPSAPGPHCGGAGESCSVPGDCCGQICNSSTDERQICELLAGCRVQGELCVGANDCCSGVCNTDKTGASRCSPQGPCTLGDDFKPCNAQVGDLCKNSDECCSRVCIADTSNGVNRCAPAPGCRPACDLCTQNADCCSNNCVAGPDLVGRCTVAEACLPEGETCTRDDQCCQTNGKMRCLEEPKGLKGRRCVVDDPGAACLPDGSACALASRCCHGHCLPSPSGGFVCASECVKESQPCTSRADCCNSHADCLAIEGVRTCREMAR